MNSQTDVHHSQSNVIKDTRTVRYHSWSQEVVVLMQKRVEGIKLLVLCLIPCDNSYDYSTIADDVLMRM